MDHVLNKVISCDLDTCTTEFHHLCSSNFLDNWNACLFQSSRNVRKAFQASCDQAAISEQPRMPGLTRHESFSDAGWCWAIWAIWARRLLRPIALAQPRHRHDSMLLGVTAPRVHLGDSLDWRQVLWGSFLSQTRLTSQVHFHKCTYIQLTRY